MQIVKPKPNQEVIKLLQQMLDMANTGELQGVAIAGALTGNKTCNAFVEGGNGFALLAEITVLNRDFMDLTVDLRCGV